MIALGASVANGGAPSISIPEAGAAVLPAPRGAHIAIVTDHSEATRAAYETLHAGGNAVDAAITAALTLGVVSPAASGIGGGGFAMVYDAKTKEIAVYDFRETAPMGLTAAMLAKGGPEGAVIGVPGEPLGLATLHRAYGKRTLAEDVSPAARIAREGFVVGRYLADQTARYAGEFAKNAQLSALLLPHGKPRANGDPFVRSDLAKTIERFGKEGAAPFYRGDIAERLVSAARKAGSPITLQDFTAYEVKKRKPLRQTVGDLDVATMPAPSAGGLMLLEALNVFGAGDASSLKNAGFESSDYLHRLGQSMRWSTKDRAAFASDPDFEKGTDKAYADALRPEAIQKRRVEIEKAPTPKAKTPGEQGTSHLIVVDAEGNIVSLTTTINGPYGAWVIEPETGILLNNEMLDFTTGKGSEKSPNRVRGGARPVSSMTPTIIIRNGQPVLSVGGSGGTRIATGVTQVAMCRLTFGLDANQCVSAPRIFVTAEGNDLLVDPDVVADVRAGLKAKGNEVREEMMTTSAMHLVTFGEGGEHTVSAAADPRKSAFALVQ